MNNKKYCYNCGKAGHTYNICMNPITSYGMILYRIKDQQPYYLMIQRSYTPDFKELIRGKFDFEEPDYIQRLISRITLHEINYIRNCTHKQLYNDIEKYYKVKKNRQYHDNYQKAKDNYQKLMNGYQNSDHCLIKFDKLIKRNNPTYYLEPDWGFPKGRRNYKGHESDLECAMREATEETGILPASYSIIPNIYATEVYCGTNDVQYAHKYFIALCPNTSIYYIDPFNKHQLGEIRKMGWYPYNQAINMIRPYHSEKVRALTKIHQNLIKNLPPNPISISNSNSN